MLENWTILDSLRMRILSFLGLGTPAIHGMGQDDGASYLLFGKWGSPEPTIADEEIPPTDAELI